MRSLPALRELARKRDTDFDKRVLRAEMNLRSVQYRNRIEASERLLDAPTPAHTPGLCLHCLEAIPGRTK